MRSPGRYVVQALPVALLLTGISVHGALIVDRDEDPQRGSAFAMFGTVDIGATRRVRATTPGEPAVVLTIPAELEDLRVGLVDSPTDDSARRFAERLLRLEWQVSGAAATVGDGVTFDTVRVEVLGLDADGRTFSRQVLADAVAEARAS